MKKRERDRRIIQEGTKLNLRLFTVVLVDRLMPPGAYEACVYTETHKCVLKMNLLNEE